MGDIPGNQLDLAGRMIPGYWDCTSVGGTAKLVDGPLVLVSGSWPTSLLVPGKTYQVLFKARMTEGAAATAILMLQLEDTTWPPVPVQINPITDFQPLPVGKFVAPTEPAVVRFYLSIMDVKAIKKGLEISEVKIEEA